MNRNMALQKPVDTSKIRVVLNTPAKFHTFDLARQLYARQMLSAIFTGYPRFKLKNQDLPSELIHCYPYFEVAYLALLKTKHFGKLRDALTREIAIFGHRAFDAHVASAMPACDVFVSLSGCGGQAGRRAKSRGAAYICDRASTHIRFQNQIIQAECDRHGIAFTPTDPRVIATEEQEYEWADIITVPSQVCVQSFVEMGVPAAKIRCIPYGVNLSNFHPVGSPNPEKFDVLFVGGATLRKGIPYLLEAFSMIKHPRKSLSFVGVISDEMRPLIDRKIAEGESISCFGHVPQEKLKTIMSQSHVLALASVEEGLALVQPQAMACACPVVATIATGARDLFTDGVEGYIIADRDLQALAERLQHLADHPEVRDAMSKAARKRVETFGGWEKYGDTWADLCVELSAGKGN